MGSSLVVLSEAEFLEWASSNFIDFVKTHPARGRETVIQVFGFAKGFELHVYTSLEHGRGRGKAAAVIRLTLYDAQSHLSIGTSQLEPTADTTSTVWERLNALCDDMTTLATDQIACRKCQAHSIQRTNKQSGQAFWGCSAFPSCGKPTELPRQHPLFSTPASAKTKTTTKTVPAFSPKKPPKPLETVLVSEDSRTPTADFKHLTYPFEYFNRVQSTIYQNGYHIKDNNLVLGTTTSSGKTISAELFMGDVLHASDRTVMYVSPLKSLTQEKYDEWQKTFPDKKICILTGDYSLSDTRADELNSADIVCLTSEMVDSRSRKHKSERSEWIFRVGLIIIDESHIISTDRGHAVEAGIMRFGQLVPEARILCLSATMPNVGDFEQWLTKVNGKKTEVINSSWRPTVLEWHFMQHMQGRYQDMEEHKLRLMLQMLQTKPDEKFLIFVHAKVTGRKIVKLLSDEGIDSHFHSADLGMSERVDIEAQFAKRQGGLRVMVSTSTLAWGRSLPARNVIIVGVHRGLTEVDELDIVQMAGRAGRFGIDPKGDVYLICDNPKGWEFRIKNPRNVMSSLLVEGTLGFHLLAEMQNGTIWNHETCLQWFDRSLAKIQSEVKEEFVNKVLESLWKMSMLTISDKGVFSITALGRVSANLYYMPQDIAFWARNFGEIAKQKSWDSDLLVSWALGAAPSYQLPYVPKQDATRVETYIRALGKTSMAAGVLIHPFKSVKAADIYDLITDNEARIGIRGMQMDAARIMQALRAIDAVKGWDNEQYWRGLGVRVQYGVGRELVPLLSITGIGAARARNLHKIGIRSVLDVRHRDNRKKLISTLGRRLAKEVIEELASKSRH